MADELKITLHKKPGGPQGLVTNQRLYETRDGRVVQEGDLDAHRLIAGAGGVIPPKTAERLGISERGIKSSKGAALVVHSTAEDVKAAAEEAEPEPEPAPASARVLSSTTVKKGPSR